LLVPRPDDFHLHVRQGPELYRYVGDTAAVYGYALIMPNTLPPVRDPEGIKTYRSQVQDAASEYPWFKPLMSFKIMPDHTPMDVIALKAAGAVAGKLYPLGATTNSADGVNNIESLYPVFAAMESEGLLLLLHGEEPSAFCLDREQAFLPSVHQILDAFPRLKVVLEHVSSAAGMEFVLSGPERLGATVTVQHLLCDLDDLIGNSLNPHLFCKPVLKRPEDRRVLSQVVASGHPRVFFGSDSAPHAKTTKECDCGAAGVYTAPVALSYLAEFFSCESTVEKFVDFTAKNGKAFYGLKQVADGQTDTIELLEETWTVPKQYHGVVPMGAGTTLGWKVKK